MKKIEEKVKKELSKLIEDGYDITSKAFDNEGKFKGNILEILSDYQEWYTKSLAAVKQLIPERYEEFVQKYQIDKRKEINVLTYTISDFLNGILVRNATGEEVFDSKRLFLTKLSRTHHKHCVIFS